MILKTIIEADRSRGRRTTRAGRGDGFTTR